MSSNSARQRGISLLEVLVVLTMIGMISSVMFQGYAYMMGGYQRLRDRQAVELRQALVANWWRSSVEAAVPYYENRLAFAGSPIAMRGASFAPLWGPAGVPTEFVWAIDSSSAGLRLLYQEPPREPVVVKAWPGGGVAEFQYLSETGEWKTEWRDDRDRQIPEAVRLLVDGGGGPDGTIEVMTAIIPIRKSQYIPSTVLLYGRE